MNPFRYKNGYQDASGPIKFGTRYYNPTDHRWTQLDPLGGAYLYAGNNPVDNYDPTGRYFEPWNDRPCSWSLEGVPLLYDFTEECAAHDACYDSSGAEGIGKIPCDAELYWATIMEAPSQGIIYTTFVTGASIVEGIGGVFS